MTGTANTMAVIGLGVMSAPMAAILIDAGYEVVGFNRSPLGQPCGGRGPRRDRNAIQARQPA
jgi:3-hydroxyacyl-CoA dehydrogenase